MSRCPVLPPISSDPAINQLGQMILSMQQQFQSGANLLAILQSDTSNSFTNPIYSPPLFESGGSLVLQYEAPLKLDGGTLGLNYETPLFLDTFSGTTYIALKYEDPLTVDGGTNALTVKVTTPIEVDGSGNLAITPPTSDGNTYFLSCNNGTFTWIKAGTC